MGTPSRLVRRDRPDVAVVATLDRIPAVAFIDDARLDAAGRISLEYAGGSKVDWDGQTTACCGAERIFLDEAGAEVLESAVVLKRGGRVVSPRWRPAVSPVAGSIEPMMVISTAHITPATLAALRSESGEGAPHRVIPHAYGVILYVGEAAPCAEDLAAPLALARRNGCVWLNLDCDAAELEGLAVHDWGAEGAP